MENSSNRTIELDKDGMASAKLDSLFCRRDQLINDL